MALRPRFTSLINWLTRVGWWALPAGAAIWLYGPAARLPLIYDTLLHIRIAGELDLLSVWQPTEAFGFYRPLTFLPLILIRQLWGYYPPLLLNALNIGQHALNTVLAAWLAWRLWGNGWRAGATGLLLAFFPFSYQAVAVYGHAVHPTTTGLLLLNLHLYLTTLKATGRRRRWGWVGMSLLFLLSLLSHESALVTGVLLGLVQAQGTPQRGDWRAGLRPALLFTLAGLAYALLYQFLPITRAPQAVATEAGWQLKWLYLLQGGSYPLLSTGLIQGPAASLIGLAAGLTALISWQRGRRQAGRALLLGWGWWGVASLLIALPLPTGYLLNGPRLLYLSSVGLALVWATLLVPTAPQGRGWRWLGPAALLLLLIANAQFVRDRLAAYQRLTAGVPLARQTAATQPAAAGLLFINLPQWFAPLRNTYPLGGELVAQLGDYLFTAEWVDHNLRRSVPAAAIRVDDLLRDPGYGYGVQAETSLMPIPADWAPAGSAILLTRYTADGPEMEAVGHFIPPAAANSPPLAQLGPYILHQAQATRCAGRVTLQLVWSAATTTPLPPTLSVAAHLLSAQGTVVAQADRPPLDLRPDLMHLPSGWRIQEERQLTPPADVTPRLVLAVYDYVSGARFPAVDAAGAPLSDNAWSIVVEACPTP